MACLIEVNFTINFFLRRQKILWMTFQRSVKQILAMEYKIVLMGDGGVGKTCLIHKLNSHFFEQRYIPTLGVVVHPFKFKTNLGEVTLNVWDTAGQEKLTGLRQGYYDDADGAIVMYDSQSMLSFKNVTSWINDFANRCPNSPIVICANKIDINPSKIQTSGLLISVKNSSNIKDPFLELFRLIMKNETLIFVD